MMLMPLSFPHHTLPRRSAHTLHTTLEAIEKALRESWRNMCGSRFVGHQHKAVVGAAYEGAVAECQRLHRVALEAFYAVDLAVGGAVG